MEEKIIRKTKSLLKRTPNLVNYERVYRRFRWTAAEAEISWFEGKKLNAAYNAIDRNAVGVRKNKIALYWHSETDERKKYTFAELSVLSNKFGNLLKKLAIARGDRVFFFLPRVPELYYGFLGALKIGAIAGTLFSAFGPQALLDRLLNAGAKILVTNKTLYPRVEKIRKKLPDLKKVILVEDLEKLIKNLSPKLEIAKMHPQEPAFMLYTSGTTGKPKGVIHAHQAILVEHMTAKWVLDLSEDDVYWCVPSNTIVVANPGPKKIAQLSVGDCILSHRGTFLPIKHLYRRTYNGPLIKINTYYSNIPMFLTPNHRVLAGRRGKKAIDWVPAGDLTKEDCVLFPRIREIHDRKTLSICKIIKGCHIEQGKVQRKKLRKRVKDEIKITRQFMRLAGYYIAEGSLGARTKVVQFSFKKDEEKLANDVLLLLKSVFGVNGFELPINNLLEIRVNSAILAEVFESLFGRKSHLKKVPQWFLYLPAEKLKEFIKGFWRGDGDADRDRYRFCTTSPFLAYQLKLIFHRLGLISTFRRVTVGRIRESKIGERVIRPKHDCYYLTIGGRCLENLSKILNESRPFLDIRSGTYQYARLSPNFIWIPIRSIQNVPYKGEVYNLETEGGSYVLNNMSVHNCTADPGWVTGIAYEILGSWSNGASTLVYEGRFDPKKWYWLIQEYKVNVWYTAPTAIRMLAAAGKELVKKYDTSSLRHLASVGEPLNPEAVWWGLKAFGLPFHDNWWQTETGGILIANYPCMDIKPGSMGKPVPGIVAGIVNDKGRTLGIKKVGNLAIKPPWPSMMRKIWRRPTKYKSYFLPAGRHGVGNWYITGDLAYKDKDGYFWFVGRADDVIKTAGERVGPFEVESAVVSYPGVVEAGVIGKPDPLRGEIIKAFVVLKKGIQPSNALKEKLKMYVKLHLAGHAYPREIEFIDKLPKTRSGKIVRRFLKAKELGLPVGDTSTLEEF
jgi:acyl-coenzyme A synthetase/AMP-(fatty) acid ligase